MKVHLRQIPQGETLHLEGEEDGGFLELEEVGAQAVSPVFYSLDAGLSDGGLFAAGRVSVRVRLKCVACLEPFEMDLVIDSFATQKELDGRELVDLTPEIREDIHLALPTYPRCDSEGGKTCPASFPQAPAEDAATPIDSGNAAWEALDKLKNKD
jgi:uncharacterized metal-binding protein YceD (DUF177 family)